MKICIQVITSPDQSEQFDYQSSVIHLGRDPSCDLAFDDNVGKSISWRHARIDLTPSGVSITDSGSSNGTFVNDRRITAKVPLKVGDYIQLGQSGLALKIVDVDLSESLPNRSQKNTDPASAMKQPSRSRAMQETPSLPVEFAPHPPAATHSLKIEGHDVVLGRAAGCDYMLNYPMISSRHARLVRTGKQIFIEDLGSSNGTFVNGRRIKTAEPVRTGDAIGLGSFTLTLEGGDVFAVSDSRGNMTIEARGVTVEVPGRRLIEDISLSIQPSEFVGLMGPSGAGKTTLMSALNGYTPLAGGKVLLNGRDLYACYASFQGQIGYVPQEDIIHRDLTVGQALYFTARLRLPQDFSDADIRARVKAVLKQLGLEAAENVPVGSPEKKGISGGQRKRVNLAMEILTDPSVLFLDEPTSGLSSEDTLLVMRLLRQLADGGKTILLTIHQPSLEAFRLLDNLVVIAKDSSGGDPGRLAYYGPAYPDAVSFFNPNGILSARPGAEPSPDEILRGLGKAKAADWVQSYNASRYRKEFVVDRARDAPKPEPPPDAGDSRGEGLEQWKTLVRRCVAVKVKDRWNTAILLAQAPIIAVLIVLVFGNEASDKIVPGDFASWMTAASAVTTTIFDLVLAAIWFGCSNAAREIVAERAIYQRERMVNLRITSYVASKLAVLGALCLFQCAVLIGIVYFGSGLKGPLVPMFALLFLASIVGLAVGLLVSAVARTPEMAVALVPLLILPMLILGGAMQPIHKMSSTLKPASFAMPSRWGFEGLLLQESAQQQNFEPSKSLGLLASGHADSGPAAQDMAEKSFPVGTDRATVFSCFLALATMFILLVGASIFVLRRRDIH